MNKPTYVAFSTQKGGAGKTTITVLVASYLHYVRGYDVAVVDCDFPQYSIHDMRRRDMDMTMKDDHYKAMAYEQFRRLDKKAYPVLCCKPEDAVATAEKLAGTGRPLNFVFFDLPTHTKTERRHAAQFRKALEMDGFAMMQYSVYVRHCVSKENMEVHIRRVRKSMPPSGMTSILSVTDKQYGEILNFWGKVERAGPEIPQQLEFF